MKRVVEVQEAGARKAEREIGVTKIHVPQRLLESYENATERKASIQTVRRLVGLSKSADTKPSDACYEAFRVGPGSCDGRPLPEGKRESRSGPR